MLSGRMTSREFSTGFCKKYWQRLITESFSASKAELHLMVLIFIRISLEYESYAHEHYLRFLPLILFLFFSFSAVQEAFDNSWVRDWKQFFFLFCRPPLFSLFSLFASVSLATSLPGKKRGVQNHAGWASKTWQPSLPRGGWVVRFSPSLPPNDFWTKRKRIGLRITHVSWVGVLLFFF